ncbi:cation:proton antiporter domain-containing protein [Streptomyces narbonensis]
MEGVGFGFLVPVFFVVTGIEFDLDSLLSGGRTLLLLPVFLVLFLVVRGGPIWFLAPRDLDRRDRAGSSSTAPRRCRSSSRSRPSAWTTTSCRPATGGARRRRHGLRPRLPAARAEAAGAGGGGWGGAARRGGQGVRDVVTPPPAIAGVPAARVPWPMTGSR